MKVQKAIKHRCGHVQYYPLEGPRVLIENVVLQLERELCRECLSGRPTSAERWDAETKTKEGA
jgi:hypothetical protein